MSSCMSLEEKYDALLKSYHSALITKQDLQRRLAKSEGRNADLRKQLSVNEFKVEIPEFDGEFNPEEFLEWLHTVERIFKYQEVPENKKMKLVALRLTKYASLWWTNLCAKRVRDQKKKIRSWEKMKAKLKDRFLPPSYIPICSKCQDFWHISAECTHRRVITLQEEEKESSVEEKHEKEKESLEEVVDHTNEVGLQTLKQKSHEGSLPTKKATTLVPLSIPSPPLKISQTYPPQNSIQLNHSPASNKSTLKVHCHDELRAFKEWKFIVQAEWKVQLSKDELFEWLILVFELSKAQNKHQD